jgi:predicted phage terminase large subunit-like protein
MKRTLTQIAEEFGDTAPAQYLRHRYSKPENITEFVNLFPDHMTIKSPPFHKDILGDFALGGNNADAAPRGFAKSTITNVIAASWKAIYGKSRFILMISDTYTQARMQLGALKAELEGNEALKEIYGNLEGPVWGENNIIINSLEGPVMVKALGAGMKIRGLKFRQFRPDLAILDDLENQELVASKERRDKLERWFEFDLMPAMAIESSIFYIGTILHHSSLLQKVISKEGKYASWKTRLYKAITDGKSLWPEAYTIEKLIAMRDNPADEDYVGPLVFAQEYQNEPQDDKDRIFQQDWLSVRYTLAEEQAKWTIENPDDPWETKNFIKIITGVDPAISEKETADYFAMITVGIDKQGHIWILDYFKERISDPLKQVQVIIDNNIRWKNDRVKVEVVAYQQGLYNMVQRIAAQQQAYVPLSPFRPDKDKVRRARIHSANFAGKLIHIREDHPLAQDFIAELLQFPLGEHDDMLDAFMNASEETVRKSRPRVFSSKPAGF